MMPLDPIMSAVLRLGLAALLLSAAWHKLRHLPAFRGAIAGYGLVPSAAVEALSVGLVAAEIALGFGLLVSAASRWAALGSATLLAIYTAAIAVNLARGRTRIDCGCAGPAGALPLSGGLVRRNALLILLALSAALPSAPRDLAAIDACVIAAATMTFALLYAAAETAAVNRARGARVAPPIAGG